MHDTNQAVPCVLAGQDRQARVTFDQARPHPEQPETDSAREHHGDDQHVTALAAALYIAQYAYGCAITSPNPAAKLDDMCDSVAEVWDDITPKLPEKFAGADLEFAETMRAAIADRLWAFTAVEYARIEAGDGYGYLFDYLAESLRGGADPHVVRQSALDAPGRIRASCIVSRIQEARDKADGPWAGILDIVLDAITEGADPQAVCDQVLGLMAQVRSESAEAGAR